MKKLITLIAVIASLSSFATVSPPLTGTATATGSASIITPIAIATAGNMNFGSLSVSATAGQVILNAAGNRSANGGVTLPSTTGTVSVASFNVTGLANSTYSITLPVDDYVISGAGSNMIINAFTNNLGTTGTLSGEGKQTINVGATLNVKASQAAGTYTNSTGFGVTVNYN